jgi:D-alanyl-D-alanine carboxypeptidase
MKKFLFKIFAIFFTYHLIAQPGFHQEEFKIDSIMKAHIIHTGKRPVHSFLLYAKNDKTGFEVHKGFGTQGRNEAQIDAEYQFNCASITKTFIATIILQLEEEGKLTLSDKVYQHLQAKDFVRVDQIHILDGTNYSNEITIEQLLQHTSGLADIFTDAETRFNISVLLHKKRQYDTKMIMDRFFRYNLHKKPHNRPGEGYHYSDINYMLLGFIIEQTTGQTLPQAIRERILKRADMQHTYFEYYEPAITEGKRVDAFLGKINMTEKINTSYEWGGGGLVTTTKDLGAFIKLLFNNSFFHDSTTLKKMTDFEKVKNLGANYGLGMFSFEVNGKTYYGHGGFYGSLLLYEPIDGITFSANIAQAIPPYDTEKLVIDLLTIIDSE